MTVLHQQKIWFINNCRWIYAEMCIIKFNQNGNDKHNYLFVILVKCITQLQTKVFHSNNSMEFIELKQIYFEPHSHFGDILHYINGVEHIVNLMTSCDTFKRLLCIFMYLLHKRHMHCQRILLSINANDSVSILDVLSLTVYDMNNCIKLGLKQVNNYYVKHIACNSNE